MEHRDLVTLTAYMAEHGYAAEEIAYAVEKPWKFTDVLAEAEAQHYAEREDIRSGNVWSDDLVQRAIDAALAVSPKPSGTVTSPTKIL